MFSYDRPGIGRSEWDGLDHSPSNLIEHAHAVLEAANIPPPYVLVGHSWGGTLALYYAGMHPDEIVGIVYLDPFDPRETRCEVRMITGEECEAAKAEAAERLSRLPLSEGRMAELEATRVFMDSPLENRALPPDPDVPTGVLLATLGPPDPEDWVDGWLSRRVSRYAEWIRNRPKATLIVATDAVHFVHREVPTLTTEVVRRVLETPRRSGRVPAAHTARSASYCSSGCTSSGGRGVGAQVQPSVSSTEAGSSAATFRLGAGGCHA